MKQGVILVYDITNRSSFDKVQYWVDIIQTVNRENNNNPIYNQ